MISHPYITIYFVCNKDRNSSNDIYLTDTLWEGKSEVPVFDKTNTDNVRRIEINSQVLDKL